MVQTHGKRPAVKDGEGRILTYGQMASQADSISSALLAATIGPGSRVAVFQEPSSDLICSLLGILRIGAVYLPLDPGMPISRLAVIVEQCRPSAILVHTATETHSGSLKSEHAKIINISTLVSPSTVVTPNCARSDSPAIILFTSGSTGIPKGIVLRHCSLLNDIECSAHIYGLESEIVLQQSTLNF